MTEIPSSRRTGATIAIALAALSAGAVMAATAASSSSAGTDGGVRQIPANRGMVMAGLHAASSGPCKHAFQVAGVLNHGNLICSHGPDPSDSTTGYAYAAASRSGGSSGSTGKGGKTSPSPSPTPTPTSSSGTTTSGACGTDGARVQALYVHAADVADSYNTYLPSIQQWAAAADSVFANSAAETGGVRHIRYLTDASCVPVVADVTVSSTGDDTFNNTISELQSQGYNRSDRKYLIWVDANIYCGIGTVTGDDSVGSANANNLGPSFARVDRGCWGGQSEAHELMHNLGGVQLSAPHSTGAWHCTDEYDRMCYGDGGPTSTMTYPCASSHESLFDCGHDDYFNTKPAAGSYLATHWNAADSIFLSTS